MPCSASLVVLERVTVLRAFLPERGSSSHGKAWKPPRAPTPRPVYWRLAWAVLGTGSQALCPLAPPLPPQGRAHVTQL